MRRRYWILCVFAAQFAAWGLQAKVNPSDLIQVFSFRTPDSAAARRQQIADLIPVICALHPRAIALDYFFRRAAELDNIPETLKLAKAIANCPVPFVMLGAGSVVSPHEALSPALAAIPRVQWAHAQQLFLNTKFFGNDFFVPKFVFDAEFFFGEMPQILQPLARHVCPAFDAKKFGVPLATAKFERKFYTSLGVQGARTGPVQYFTPTVDRYPQLHDLSVANFYRMSAMWRPRFVSGRVMILADNYREDPASRGVTVGSDGEPAMARIFDRSEDVEKIYAPIAVLENALTSLLDSREVQANCPPL